MTPEELRATMKAGLAAMSDGEVAQELKNAANQIEATAPDDPEGLVATLLWREAAARLLGHAPTVATSPKPRFRIQVDVDPRHPLGHFSGLFDGSEAELFNYLLRRLVDLGVHVKIEGVEKKE